MTDQPGYGYSPPPDQPGYAPGDHHVPAAPPRKRRRVFMWVFMVIQALFLAWLIYGFTIKTGPSQAQIAQGCYNHAWWPLFKSQADCVKHYGGALTGAGDVGKGLGIALIIALWAVVDIILGISYGVYRLATRNR